MQIDELGLLESPIALTNTLSVGRVQDYLIQHIIDRCELEEEAPKSINAVVGECNDAKINDVTKRTITEKHLKEAFENASEDFELGSVGAGRGMVCYGLKGGIGSSSRVVNYNSGSYTIGALSLCNQGLIHQLTINGKRIGEGLAKKINEKPTLEKGSIVVIIATDAPLDSRQLKRLAKRATAGIARTGSEFGNGSGDIVIAFSTKNKVKHAYRRTTATEILDYKFLNDRLIDDVFTAGIEAVEESIYSAILNAERVGEKYKSYKDFRRR